MHDHYEITIVNHPDPTKPEHRAPKVSKRRQRAIKLARQLRRDGNQNVMLWSVHKDGKRLPVSLSQEVNLRFVGAAMGSKIPASREAVSRQNRNPEEHAEAVDAFRGMLAARLVREGIV